MNYPGHYNDGQSANRYDVTVSLNEAGLVITGEELPQPIVWLYEDLVAVDDIARQVPFRIGSSREEDARLTLNDQRVLSDFRSHAPQLFGPPASRRLRNAVLAVAATVMLAAGLWFGIPLASRLVAAIIPVSWEVALSDQFADDIVRQFASMTDDSPRVCSNQDGVLALERLVGELADVGGSPYDFDVKVIDGRLNNAFAMPGGRIFIFRGLLDFTQSPDELTAVLAHEMGHVTLQHGTRAIIQGLGISFVFSVLIGDVGGGVIAAAGEILLRMSYSREAESEADRSAIELLQKAGYRFKGLSSFFERIGEENKDLPAALQILSTHPSDAKRAALTRGLTDNGRSAFNDAEWRAIQNICAQ